jgi:SAM-dependent methyltransferase
MTVNIADYMRTEDNKYSSLYVEGYEHGPVDRLLAWVKNQHTCFDGTASVIDLGCGRALAACRFPWRRYVGIDISSLVIDEDIATAPGHHRFIHGSIHDLRGFKCREFDVALSIDVLEHLPESLIDPTISEMVRVSRRSHISISTRESSVKAPDGSGLHLTVKPVGWWLEMINQHTRITNHEEAQYCVMISTDN